MIPKLAPIPKNILSKALDKLEKKTTIPVENKIGL